MVLRLVNQLCDLKECGFILYAFLLKVEIHFPSARQFQTERTSDELNWQTRNHRNYPSEEDHDVTRLPANLEEMMPDGGPEVEVVLLSSSNLSA